MRRIRLLRILLPLLFLGFLVTIALTVRTRPARRLAPVTSTSGESARMEGFRFSDLVGGRRRLLVEAGVGSIDEDGSFSVEDVRRAEIDREGKPPLVLSAPKGSGTGTQGKRVMRLEGGVTLRDDAAGLSLTIPTVEVDQVAGVVRSFGEVQLAGGVWRGTASAVEHSLTGGPDRLRALVLDGDAGEHLEAQQATLDQASATLTLEGKVVAQQGGFEIRSERVVAHRDAATGRLRRVDAGPGVSGSGSRAHRGTGRFQARDATASWGASGEPETIVLSGEAAVQATQGTVNADRIEVTAVDESRRRITSNGAVVVTGAMKRGPGRLDCDALQATLTAEGEIRDGTATGNVKFAGDGTTGEAAEARFNALETTGAVTLLSGQGRRARVANGRTRVAAETITSDLGGRRIEARGRVESTLLPDPARRRATPMFSGGEAVHFVSSSLVSDTPNGTLVFQGDVRGWQGERSLAAQRVEVRQQGETLDADGNVATRVPREAGAGLRDADYVQVTSDRLSYRGESKTAAYDGHVRVRQAEGWLEAPHLEGSFGQEGEGGLRTATATGGVRFEFRSRGSSGAVTTATGRGDRAAYEAAGRAVRLFGDQGAATIVASGEKAGSTSGRVLRYELETGALEVESGDRDRATIKTPTE